MKLVKESELLRAAEEKGIIAKRLAEFKVGKATLIDGSIRDLIEIAAQQNSVLLYYYVFAQREARLINCAVLSEALTNDDILGDYYEGTVFSDAFFNVLYNMTLPDDSPEKKTSYRLNNLQQYERDILKECQEYNDTVDFESLNVPIGLKAFVPVNGFAIAVNIEETEDSYSPTYRAASEVIARHAAEIDAIIQDARKKQEEGEARLRILMLKDENFHVCRNKSLREKYATELWKSNEWIRDLFSDEPDSRRKYPERRFLEMVELTYAEYRNDKTIVDAL